MQIPLIISFLEKHLGRGTLIDNHNYDWPPSCCPHCEARWHISYLDDDWKGNQSSPDDVFECPNCGAFFTRRDSFGDFENQKWDKDHRR